MTKLKIKRSVESVICNIIDHYGLTVYGEEMIGTVNSVSYNGQYHTVSFDDEYVAPLLAGNVMERVWDEMKEKLKDKGLRIIDSSGSELMVTTI